MSTLELSVVQRRRPAWSVGKSTSFALVVLVALASLAPFGFLLFISMQPVGGEGPGTLWVQLFQFMPVGPYLLNSAIVSLGTTAVVLITSAMAGFGFAKLKFPGSNFLFVALVATISVPLATIILPNYLNFARIGGIGTYWGPIVLYAAGNMPFSTVLMANFFKSIPDELVESAIVDGASYPQVFRMVMLRIAGPALVTVGVICFLGVWNDLLIALLLLPDPAMRTISVGVAALQGVRIANLDIVLTGSLISAIPPILAFILFQKYLVAGVTSGITK